MRIDAESETLIVANTLKGNSGRLQIEGTYVPVDEGVMDCAGTMVSCAKSGGFSNSIDHAAAGYMVPVAFAQNTRDEVRLVGGDGTPTGALGANEGMKQRSYVCGFQPTAGLDTHPTALAVRRLLPVECERLQGFPDNYTAVMFQGKPAKDGPRYKALGNSMAVPNIRWIINRIRAVDAAHQDRIS